MRQLCSTGSYSSRVEGHDPQALLMRRGELISNQRKNTTLSLKKCIKLNYLQIVCPVVYLEQNS